MTDILQSLQSSSEEGSDPSAKLPSVTFEFPTIPVRGTPARWLHHSHIVNMTSHHHDDSSADEATSSLGDSTYDFIDDRSVITTDDESQDGMAESIMSSDGHEADQLHGHIDDLELLPNEEATTRTCNAHVPRSSSPPRSPKPPILTGRGVPYNAQTPLHDDQGSITFEEPSVVDLASSRLAEVSHTLELLQPTGDSTVILGQNGTVTVRQTMASRNLDLGGRSYKVLYVGDPASKDTIVQKLATALATSPRDASARSDSSRASKFNVVPISSFGDDTSPEVVLIESSGVELEVDECTETRLLEAPQGSESLKLSLTDGSNIMSTGLVPNFSLSNEWRLPDLAIFCASEDDNVQAKLTRRFSRLFMNRHSVPSIIITTAPQWKKPLESFTLDHLTPHICLENQTNVACRPQILKRLPIDLDTFLKIDSGQMNRNLACLSKARSAAQRGKQTGRTDKLGKVVTDGKGPFTQFVPHWPPYLQRSYGFVQRTVDTSKTWKLIGFLLVSICFARLTGYAGTYSPSNGEITTYAKLSSIPTTSVAPIPTPHPFSSTLGFTASYTSSILAQVSPIKSLSTDTDIASFFLDDTTQTSDKTETFKAHLLGDCHILMRPPHWFTKLRKAPSLSFKISRQDSPLEYQISTLFDGVYALQVPREEAYGILSVEIWTQSRPIIKETSEVDFGSSWLKYAAWKRATRVLSKSVQNELSQMQTSLSTAYRKTIVEISTMVQKNKKAIARQQETDRGLIARHLKHSMKTRDVVVAQTRDLTHHLVRSLQNGKTTASAQFRSFGRRVTKELTTYTHNRTAMFSQQAQLLSRSATGIDVQALIREVRGIRLPHLRNAQKHALKGWWRIRGLPKQKMAQQKKEDLYRRKGFSISGEQA